MSVSIMRDDILGFPYAKADGLYIRAKAHAALTAYTPYVVLPSYDATDDDGRAVTAACTAEASVRKIFGVPQQAYASGDIAELLVMGPGKMLVSGDTDVAQGDYLKIVPGTSATNAVKDGAALTESSVAVFADAAYTDATAVAKNVQMWGLNRVVNT
jgi:hypothetical protein